jgi:hypothetical protein
MALERAVSDPETIRNTRWMNAPVLFPDHSGVQRRDATIYDIMDVNRYAANNRSLMSGFPVRRSFTDDSWAGAGRYSMEPLG